MAYIGKQQDANKKTVFPVTVAKAVLVESEGKSVEECIQELSSYKGDAIAAKEAAVAAKTEAVSAKDGALEAKAAAESASEAAGKAAETYGAAAGASAAEGKIVEALGDGGVINEAVKKATDRIDNASELLEKITGMDDIPTFEAGKNYEANAIVKHNDDGVWNIYRFVNYTPNAQWTPADETKIVKTSSLKEIIRIIGVNNEILNVYVTLKSGTIDFDNVKIAIKYTNGSENYSFVYDVDSNGKSADIEIPSGVAYSMQVQVMDEESNLANSVVYRYIASNGIRTANIRLEPYILQEETVTVTSNLYAGGNTIFANYDDISLTITDQTDASYSRTESFTRGSSDKQGKVTFRIPFGHTFTLSYSIGNVAVDGTTYSYIVPKSNTYVAAFVTRAISNTYTQMSNSLFELAYEYVGTDGTKKLGITTRDNVRRATDEDYDPEVHILDTDVKFVHINPTSLTSKVSSVSPLGNCSFWIDIFTYSISGAWASSVLASQGSVGGTINSSNYTTYLNNANMIDGFALTEKQIKWLKDKNLNTSNIVSPILQAIRGTAYDDISKDLTYTNVTNGKRAIAALYQAMIVQQLCASRGSALDEILTFFNKRENNPTLICSEKNTFTTGSNANSIYNASNGTVGGYILLSSNALASTSRAWMPIYCFTIINN